MQVYCPSSCYINFSFILWMVLIAAVLILLSFAAGGLLMYKVLLFIIIPMLEASELNAAFS